MKRMRGRWTGGFNIPLAGRPGSGIRNAEPVDRLNIPLHTPRCQFSEIQVSDGQAVSRGDILAVAPLQFNIPLLSSRKGIIRFPAALKSSGNLPHATLESDSLFLILDIDTEGENGDHHPKDHSGNDPSMTTSPVELRKRLVQRGAWLEFIDAFRLKIPDPKKDPVAVIVSTLRLEPFGTRGDVLIREDETGFEQGLRRLREITDAPILLILPDTDDPLAERLAQRASEMNIMPEYIPLLYPFDHPAFLAGKFLSNRQRGDGPAWYLRAEGVFAVHHSLNSGQPWTERVVSVGGPSISKPEHLRAPMGYPISELICRSDENPGVRIIRGGILTGNTLKDRCQEADKPGIDAECSGITVLPEPAEREFLGFLRPGSDRHSFSHAFLSALRGFFPERLTTALRGEERACISCGYCESVCPMGLMPHLINRYCESVPAAPKRENPTGFENNDMGEEIDLAPDLSRISSDDIEAVEQAGLELCIHCGLCSYVCPSKIDLQHRFQIMRDLLEKSVPAAKGGSR